MLVGSTDHHAKGSLVWRFIIILYVITMCWMNIKNDGLLNAGRDKGVVNIKQRTKEKREKFFQKFSTERAICSYLALKYCLYRLS